MVRDVASVDRVDNAKHRKPLSLPYRAREGPALVRASSPRWDTTMIRIRSEDKDRFDVLRVRLSRAGRVRPYWEVFALLVEAGAGLSAREWRAVERRMEAREDASPPAPVEPT